jgi:hypothetical protein
MILPELVLDRLMNEMRMLATAIALLVWTLNLACGEGGGTSGGPTQPLPPDLGADIVAAGAVSIGLCSGPGCSYSLNYRNDGRGCGNTVHGKVRAFSEESLLETDDWWLVPTQVVGPGETFLVEDCCFGPDTVTRATRFVSETFWNNVPCS